MSFLLTLALKSILSSVIGSSFYRRFQSTKLGIWFQNYVNKMMTWVAIRYDIEVAKKEAKWRQDYPLLSQRIDAIEEDLDDLYKKVNSKTKN